MNFIKYFRIHFLPQETILLLLYTVISIAVTHACDSIYNIRVIGKKINLTTFNVGSESFIKAEREKKKKYGRWPLWGATVRYSHANWIRKITANVHKLPPTCQNDVEITRNGFLVSLCVVSTHIFCSCCMVVYILI